MKKLFYTMIVFVSTLQMQFLFGQTVLPFIEWTNEFIMPGEHNNFMDYTDDACMLGWAGTGAEANLASVNSDGTTNYLITEIGLPGFKLAEICNSGMMTHAYLFNSSTNEIQLALCNNEVIEILYSHIISIPAQYTNIEIVSADMNTSTFERHSILLRVFDTADSKWKVLLVNVNVDLLGDTATHEIIAILIGLYATFPSSVLVTNENLTEVCGFFNKNASGSNHDIFISKINEEDETIYSRTHASYLGRNDVPIRFVYDSLEYLYIVSQSQDNVSPFSNHIAVFKINPVTGKRIWIKRLGEATAGSEICYDAAGNTSGDGIAITGSFSDGASGRNARTWRLNGDGNTLWFKSVNMLPAGSSEESRTVGFCPSTGDVNIAGYLDSSFFAARYNSLTGTTIWGPESFAGDIEGNVVHEKMQMDFSSTGEIIISYNRDCDSIPCDYLSTIKIGQSILKQNFVVDQNKLKLFPNPANNFILIEGILDETYIKIINLNGEVVLEKSIQSESNKIDIQNLPAGYYTISFYTNENTHTTSFIKSH